jgi:hypothetical protein
MIRPQKVKANEFSDRLWDFAARIAEVVDAVMKQTTQPKLQGSDSSAFYFRR